MTRLPLIVLALALSCTSQPGNTTAVNQPLCDGSGEARLTYVTGGGHVDQDYDFHSVYGHRAFAIDGQCRFWVAGDPLLGLRTGSLAAAQADDFAAKLHRGSLGALSRTRDVDSCPDAGESLISDGRNAINCTCGCDGLPAATQEAFRNVEDIHRSLMAMGTPSDGPLRAATRQLDPSEAMMTRTDPQLLSWTLAFSPTDLLIDGPTAHPDSGKAIESATDRDQLRGLRAMAAQRLRGAGFPVRAGEEVFRLYLRDEAPAHVVAGLAVR